MPNIKLSDAISEFSIYASASYARGTAAGLRTSLEYLLVDTGNIWLKNLTSVHIDHYIVARQEKLSASSIEKNISHLRVFFDWARHRKYLPHTSDPVGRRRKLRVIPHDFVIIPPGEFASLLDAARNARDRALIAFGLYTLARQGEVRATRIGDLDLDQGWVTVRVQKSGILDRMPVCAELSVELARWLQVYQQRAGRLQKDWMLFPATRPFGYERNEKGRIQKVADGDLRLIPTSAPTKVNEIVHYALERLGYPTSKEGGHTLRRSAARARFDQLVAEGYDGALREVQALLHHASSRTTEQYLGLTVEVRKRNDAIRGRRMFGPQDRTGLRVVPSA